MKWCLSVLQHPESSQKDTKGLPPELGSSPRRAGGSCAYLKMKLENAILS